MTIFYQSAAQFFVKTSLLVVFLLPLGAHSAFSQSDRRVRGTLRNPAGDAVAGASVRLVSERDSVQTSSGAEGGFTFNKIRGQRLVLTVTSLGYDTLRQTFVFDAGENELQIPPLVLREASHLLGEVSVTGTIPITVKEDTLEYSTRNLRLREGALVEDALKKLDGVEVDKDGNVTAQGETVTRARINGKDFFGGDIQAAIKNLPAEIIEKIQIVDDYGDMANITGNRTGDPERVLNLQIAPDKNNGDFGNFRAGGGTEDRYQATGSYGKFKEGMQLSVLGNLNNVNASLFDFNIRSGGARRSRGGGSFGRGFGGGGWGGADGLTNTQSIGINYRQDFNDKLTMYGEYSFGHTDNATLSARFEETTLINEGVVYMASNTDNGRQTNDHRFSWNIEYKPDDKNYIKLSPNLSYRHDRTNNFRMGSNIRNDLLVNDEQTNQYNRSSAPNYGISGLYNRRLSDNGRNIFLNFSLNTARTAQDQERILNSLVYTTSIADLDSIYQQHLVDLENKNLNGGTTLSYIEPLGQYSNLEVSYDFNFASYDNNRHANAYDIDGVIIDNPEYNNSRTYDYTFYTHRGSLTYRYRKDKWNYSLGVAAQPNQLRGGANIDGEAIPINRTGFNWMPVARLEYEMSRTKRFNINYTGRANEPGVTQIQPFTDYSNPNAPVTGNPELSAEFNHELRVNYRNFNVGGGNSFFVGLTGSLSEDKIVTNRTTTVDDSIGVINATEYLNANGVYNTRGFYNFSKPFADRTYTLSFNGMVSYNNNVSYVTAPENNAEASLLTQRNIAKNWVLAQGVNFRYNPKETIEVSPGVRYTYNTTRNTVSDRNNRDVSTWALTLYGSVNLTPTWIFSADLAKTTNNGYNSSVDANPMIINAYIEKQFLKGRTGAIRFQAFDLLNEQTNVSRMVTDNSIIDSRTNRLARYFMLTFSYRFSNFAGGNMFDGSGGPGGFGDGDRRRVRF
ncbi:Carboxypeptidase regulatory-like domain-containing protein [Parapedobacter composti]|uniref:Carboxypeptidase regulatory-like domain-containing protein n=1 Tax=Parapedobacter composti TaxID=623281 RepID=A0A1I1K837_9SPHI|nr:TonB-dependent receptor [Parapedobacter composti]SFC57127.1 Carboxypeptidase regulatory-like domain-containing protein [Parapedobacter composti]